MRTPFYWTQKVADKLSRGAILIAALLISPYSLSSDVNQNGILDEIDSLILTMPESQRDYLSMSALSFGKINLSYFLETEEAFIEAKKTLSITSSCVAEHMPRMDINSFLRNESLIEKSIVSPMAGNTFALYIKETGFDLFKVERDVCNSIIDYVRGN